MINYSLQSGIGRSCNQLIVHQRSAALQKAPSSIRVPFPDLSGCYCSPHDEEEGRNNKTMRNHRRTCNLNDFA